MPLQTQIESVDSESVVATRSDASGRRALANMRRVGQAHVKMPADGTVRADACEEAVVSGGAKLPGRAQGSVMRVTGMDVARPDAAQLMSERDINLIKIRTDQDAASAREAVRVAGGNLAVAKSVRQASVYVESERTGFVATDRNAIRGNAWTSVNSEG